MPHPKPRERRRQSGAALLAFALLIIGLLFGAFLSRINSVTGGREEIASDALNQAKDALVGFAATYRDNNHPNQVFGYLPCPDTNNDGIADAPCGTTDVSVVGRLPWKTLGIPPMRDSTAECLWYVVSGRAKDNPPTTSLNWDTLGQFIVQDPAGNTLAGATAHDRPLAIVIAAKAPLAGQARTPTATTECGGTNSSTDYLELLDSNWGTAGYTGDLLVRVASPDSLKNATSNDQGLWITNRDIFDRVKKRSDFKGDVDGLITDLANYLNNLAPASLPAASGSNKGIDNVIAGYLAANPSLSTRKALVLTNWKDNLLYAGGPSGYNFTVNGSPTTCRAILVFGGERTTAQSRSTAGERTNTAMYLEGSNATLFPLSGAYTGATEFLASNTTADIVRCINGLGSGNVSFSNPSDFAQFNQTGSGISTDTTDSSTPVVSLIDAAGTTGACFWFRGAIPLAGKTVRAYYNFQFLYPDTFALGDTVLDRGNGFTFQMVRNDIGVPTACGTENNLGALGSSDMWGMFSYIVETDVYQDSGKSDPDENHTAIMTNGSLSHTTGSLTTACDGSAVGCRHTPANTFEESPTTTAHNQRIEIHSGCNSTCSACNPASHVAPNTYAKITVWVDCTDCNDVVTDIDRIIKIPTVQRCRNVDTPEMDSFFFGFTGGFKSGTAVGAPPSQGVRIKNFALRSD